MLTFANVRQEAFLIVLIIFGVSSFFYGMLTSTRKPGEYKPRNKN